MIKSNGRKRVIITNVSPQVEEGEFPAKAVVDENIIISADIFVDGHDEIAASVMIKPADVKSWKEYPMTLINNDHWEYSFKPNKTGDYNFKVQGWIDHYTTWKYGLQKKFDAGQDIKVELQIGAEMLEESAEKAIEADRKQLLQWAEIFKRNEYPEKLVGTANSDEIAEVVYRNTNRSLTSLYPKTYTINVERKKAAFSTWYELFPRSTAPEPGRHGTFKDVKRLLPRIANMGFDVLYFPPIHPIGEINRKGKNNSLTAEPGEPGSPWAIGNKKGGHKAIHPELGTLKDFQSLIGEAQKHGIEIAMDIAYQCAPDHPYVEEHPQWFKWRPDGTVQYAENPPKKYEDILPINFETEDWKNLWEELKSIILYWIDKGISIFRIDNPHTKAFPFWEWMIGEVRKEYPDTMFLAEAFTRPRLMERLAKVGFTQSYTYFTWRNTKKEIEEYIKELTQTDSKNYFRPNFWPNTPDILPPALTNGGENAHIMRLLLAATLSPSYGIYGPVYEFGFTTPRSGKEEYIDNEKYEIRHWDWDQYTKIKEIITRINKIRKEHKALHHINNIAFAETTNDNIICYCKTDKETGNRLIIAVNLDPHNIQAANVKIPLKAIGLPDAQPYLVHDLLSGDRYKWQDEWNYISLDPYDLPAHVFKIEPSI